MVDAQAHPLLDIERFEQAKDARLWRFLDRSIRFLEASGLRWAAFGSCAVFAHRGQVRRLTRDLDLFLPPEDFAKLEEVARNAGLDAARERESFVRVRDDIYQIHAVPDAYILFDYRDGDFLAPIHAPIDWDSVEKRDLRFPTGLEPHGLKVAPLETVACISMMRALNANSCDDIAGLLLHPNFQSRGVTRFVAANPPLMPLIQNQLQLLGQTSLATPELVAAILRIANALDGEIPCPD